MRTTVTLDADLVEQAIRLTGTRDRAQPLRDALVALIEREASRRLALLAGTEPQLTDSNRRRPPHDCDRGPEAPRTG